MQSASACQTHGLRAQQARTSEQIAVILTNFQKKSHSLAINNIYTHIYIYYIYILYIYIYIYCICHMYVPCVMYLYIVKKYLYTSKQEILWICKLIKDWFIYL